MAVIKVRNPRTGAHDYEFVAADADAVGKAVARARDAQREWYGKGLEHRIQALSAWATALETRADAITSALADDTARTRISREELGAVIHFIHGYCEAAPEVLAQPFRKFRHNSDVVFKTTLVPYPVVGVISPWNFPLVLSFIDAIPALLAGATVVIKPSEVTPRFVEPLQASIGDVPGLDGVISLLQGAAETGRALLSEVDAIVFTGSVPTGRKIAVAAAERFIPAFLELGGKDPAVVLAGSDLARAATSILRSALYNTGQVCYAIERVYVDASIHDAFMEELVRQVQGMRRSAAAGDGGHYGPFIHAAQGDIVRAQLQDAVARGARVVTGGVVENAGGAVWLDPTIVVDVDHSMDLMTQETFGPVVPVMRFASEDEAARLANDTIFGLSGAVFGPDTHTAGDFATRMEAGGVSINDTELQRGMMFDGEKTAFKFSGMGGSRYGATSILRYVRKRALIANEGGIKPLDELSEID
ncbi:aldehyde dehydrogenase family protein [Cupriavidus oxalaticus]|uniref:Aldehyde dehydrogenase n=1 Tax=Cupriavidus oxalaticus TaxID=96344 RepID=A0A375G9P8_9BURK|nr:aldehyde dehydrogenase family protein [Cupriavidus oxalaticus]QEZ44372.1 aldehyde dehydrogenase [Cupriavidus oxalaticus]QRQ84262.1 aldehyde dehydrogenase family protein [Cupriavidus oxalaticus]QRQ91652.1 aldehyde dehydrogenase family protein [Cupriavidus oxalaticus]WQD86232.1 aldehyde dehydrogenase family protein [Cupriavidus oxalaticus]SPC05151.1 NAD-dependent aldehyde dehydrogenase [Cupriavidus oxalaticus]